MSISSGILHDTPIEIYNLNGTKVWVKREDLSATHPMWPPVSKVRGAIKLLSRLKEEGISLVGALDTKVSTSGWTVAAVSKWLGLRSIIGAPYLLGGELPLGTKKAKELGAEIYPLKPARTSIMYARLKHYLEERGGELLPAGLQYIEAVEEISKAAAKIPPCYFEGSLVLCSGTATTLSGIICGMTSIPKMIISISSGISIKKQRRTVEKFTLKCASFNAMLALPRLHLVSPIRDYYQESPVEVPFPCHPNYDAKAWEWLTLHLDEIEKPVLFWNIGA